MFQPTYWCVTRRGRVKIHPFCFYFETIVWRGKMSQRRRILLVDFRMFSCILEPKEQKKTCLRKWEMFWPFGSGCDTSDTFTCCENIDLTLQNWAIRYFMIENSCHEYHYGCSTNKTFLQNSELIENLEEVFSRCLIEVIKWMMTKKG